MASGLADASLLSGELFANYYNPANGGKKAYWPVQAAEAAWLRFTPPPAENGIKGYAAGSLTYVSASDIKSLDDQRLIAKLDEAYAEYSKSGFLLSAGKKNILWGRSDTINPTDFHTGTDQTVLNSESHVTRNSSTGLHMRLRPKYEKVVCQQRRRGKCTLWEEIEKESEWALEAVATPLFADTKPIYGLIDLPSTVTIEKTEKPEVSFGNTEYALKISRSGKGWDFSASGFRGFNHTPMLFETKRGLSGTTPVVKVTPKFAAISAFGADGSFEHNGFVYTAEFAMTWTEVSKANTEVVPLSSYQGVLGVDREVFDYFRLIVQGIYLHYPQYVDPNMIADSITRAIAFYNQTALRAQKKTQFGNSLHAIYDNPDSKFKFDLFALSYYGPNDGYAQPKLTYKWTDSFHVTIGALMFWGAKTTPLGSVRDLNSEFAELKYFF